MTPLLAASWPGELRDDAWEVRVSDGATGVYARRALAAGEVVIPLVGVEVEAPSRYSLQLGRRRHLLPFMAEGEPILDPRCAWCYLNHRCDPNVLVDTTARTVVAARGVDAGEELAFDYETTEWDLAEPFACRCGVAGCRGVVRGFRHLDEATRRALLPRVAPHLRRRVARSVAA